MEYTGSVRVKTGKNGTVSYQIVIEGEKDPVTGKRMRSYQTVHGKKRDAIRIMNQIVAEKNAGTYFKGSNLLLKDWLDQLCRPSGKDHPCQLPGQDRPLHRTSAWKYSYRKTDRSGGAAVDQPDHRKFSSQRQKDQSQKCPQCLAGSASCA